MDLDNKKNDNDDIYDVLEEPVFFELDDEDLSKINNNSNNDNNNDVLYNKPIDKDFSEAKKALKKYIDELDNQKEDYIIFDYQLTQNEVFSALEYVYKIQFGQKRIIQSILFVLVIFGLVLSTIFNQTDFKYLIIIAVALLILMWTVPYFYNKASSKKSMKSINKIATLISKEAVIFYQDGFESVLEFKDINEKTKKSNLKIYEFSDTYIFLYKENNLFSIPKRVIKQNEYKPEDISVLFKAMLKENYYYIKKNN